MVRCSILIVCEGQKTEPNYFNALAKSQQGVLVYDIEVKGIGRGTMDVVKEAIRLKNKNDYDRVWAVFDKDDFTGHDFNNAITSGMNSGIEVAWSNEAFELWYLYHFYNVTTGISRADYEKKLTSAIKNSTKCNSSMTIQKYEKNNPRNYEIMSGCGSMVNAIRDAEKQYNDICVGCNYAAYNPCTTVYRLVRQLLGEDKELNEELSKKVEGKGEG